jgi:thymidylate synthase ThyX
MVWKRLRDNRLLLQHLNSQCKSVFDYQDQVEDLMKMNPYELEKFDLRKWARGKARNLLPHGIETRGTYTSNVRGWRWFIEARSESNAETEIRSLANKVLLALRETAPLYFEDYTPVKTSNDEGIPEWKPTYSKV